MAEVCGGGEIYCLPEGCVSEVIAFTSPRDACRSSAVSTAFRAAAESDTVWERFLPPDYQSLLSRAVRPLNCSSKRDLFFRLCDEPILIDGGKMSFALERSSGKKCYMLSARQLSISWSDTPEYWRWIQLPDSRFSEIVELLDVCWLKICGVIESKMLSSKTSYAAYLVYRLVDVASGLHYPLQEATIKVGAHLSEHKICLQPPIPSMHSIFGNWHRFVAFPEAEEVEIRPDVKIPQAREDGWMEVEMGEFYNDDGDDGAVEICLREVKGGRWKSGLVVQGIEIKPKT